LEGLSDLRARLVDYVRRKFYTRRNIADTAEDIVNQVFLDVARSPHFTQDKYNFGYLSAACVRAAYKAFHQNNNALPLGFSSDLPLISEDCFVDEIMQAEDTEAIFTSLQTLKDVERTIIRERYYGDFTFREISEKHNIKLNTVLTHHRRALEKLRPVLPNFWR